MAMLRPACQAMMSGMMPSSSLDNLERVAADLHHGVDGRVEIRMFLLGPGKFETNLRLILFRHFHRLKKASALA
jgi:hypothetical protein